MVNLRARLGPLARSSDEGSAVAEFVMVGAILTVLTLAVIQLALTLYIRTTVLDAASEGARYASLAGSSLDGGVDRTRALITTAIGPSFASDVSAGFEEYRGRKSAVISVRAALPLIGLIGITNGLEVTGHASVETVETAAG